MSRYAVLPYTHNTCLCVPPPAAASRSTCGPCRMSRYSVPYNTHARAFLPACCRRPQYAWFLPIWLNYSSAGFVKRADALRPFILHAHGGTYLDLDTECYRPLEPSLKGRSVGRSAPGVAEVQQDQLDQLHRTS